MIKDRITKKVLGWSLVFLFLIAIDQTVKLLVARPFLNYRFAFGLPVPEWLMFLIYAVILLLIIRYCARNFAKFSHWQTFAWLLIFSGAISNVGERIVLGYVRDFIYIWTGVFNLADGYIITGIIMLLLNAHSEKKVP